MSIPPLPEVPEDQHGAPLVIIAGVFIAFRRKLVPRWGRCKSWVRRWRT